MGIRRSTLRKSLSAGVALGLAQPLVELWLDCRRPDSEACVWGRALLPVTLPVGAVVGLVVGAILYLLVRAWRDPRQTGDDGNAGSGDGAR